MEMAKSAICWAMIKTEENPQPNNIRALRRAQELSMATLGTKVGTDASTINKLEKGHMQLTERWLVPLASALGVSVDDILVSSGGRDPGYDALVKMPDGTKLPVAVATQGSRIEFRPAEVEPPALSSMPSNVPVMGTAAGSHLRGAFALNTSVVDYVRRPPALMGAGNAYALYIEGTSMEPRYQPGELVFVHPGRPAKMGDAVIVQVQLGPDHPIEASIGTLKRRTEKLVTIGKLNPIADVDLKKETVIAVHKVLSLNDLFGV